MGIIIKILNLGVNMEGCCPECDSNNTEYIGVDKLKDGEVNLNFQCLDCGFLGTETLETKYKGTQKMTNGEEMVSDELDGEEDDLDMDEFGDEFDSEMSDEDLDDELEKLAA